MEAFKDNQRVITFLDKFKYPVLMPSSKNSLKTVVTFDTFICSLTLSAVSTEVLNSAFVFLFLFCVFLLYFIHLHLFILLVCNMHDHSLTFRQLSQGGHLW